MQDTMCIDIIKGADKIMNDDACHIFSTVAKTLGDACHNPLIAVTSEESMSHVSEVVKHECIHVSPKVVVLEKTGRELVQGYIDSVTYGHVADFMETFVRIDVLLVSGFDYVVKEADDLSQRALKRLFEALIRNQRQVVFFMTKEPTAYEMLRTSDLYEVLNKGIVVAIP